MTENEEDEKNYDAMQEQSIPERIDEKYLTILNNLSLLVLPERKKHKI